MDEYRIIPIQKLCALCGREIAEMAGDIDDQQSALWPLPPDLPIRACAACRYALTERSPAYPIDF
jgi:hypothetical protein